MELEANIPEIRIKAKRPPINPPFNLSKFDFIKRIVKKTIVAFRDEIFKKANGKKGFNNISIANFIDMILKINFKNCIKKDSNESF